MRGRSRRRARAGPCCFNRSLSHYLPAAREVESQYLPMLRALHPSIGSWFDVAQAIGSGAGRPIQGGPGKYAFIEDEHHLGIGFLTSIACVAGLYLGRKLADLPARRGGGVHPVVRDDLHARRPVRDAGGRGQLLLRRRSVPRGRPTGLASDRAGGRAVPVAADPIPQSLSDQCWG